MTTAAITTAAITTARINLAAGLDALADYLAAHPEVPVNFDEATVTYHVSGRDGDQAGLSNLAAIAETLGVEVTDSDGGPVTATTTHYHASLRFGPVTYRAIYISRDEMADYDALMSYRDSIRADRPAVTA